MSAAKTQNNDHPLRHIDDRVDRLLDAAIEVVLARSNECEGISHDPDCDHVCASRTQAAINRLRKVVMKP